MKVAFDEHVPKGIVKVFTTMAGEGSYKGITFVSAREYAESAGQGDVPWIKRFAEDGGKVIISGDKRMRSRVHEREALAAAGMIVFFFSSAWSQKAENIKSAMLMIWWPEIQKYIRRAQPGDCWEIPFQYSITDMRNVKGPR